MKTSCAFALASAIILALCAVPASATTLGRTWVSATGANGGTCGPITSPCLTFDGALANTAAGGEIDCLGPGDFGTVQINQSVSIVCDGVSNGGIFDTSTTAAAVTIEGPSGTVVYLSGLDLEGGGTAPSGVFVISASNVYITHSSIRGFTAYGVNVASTTNPTRVFIKDSTIVNNGTAGDSNTGGVYVAGASATNAAIIVSTVIDGNSGFAAQAIGASGTSVIALTNSVLSGSPTGLDLLDGATAELVGPSNVIAGAITGTTTSVPFK
jgi:hypothetical protein